MRRVLLENSIGAGRRTIMMTGKTAHGLQMPGGERGLSMLEVVVSVTLVVAVLLASVGLATRTVAQVGYARTEQAERAARAKTVASQWLQAEMEYMRSLGFRQLLGIFLDPGSPSGWNPPDVAYARCGFAVCRDVTATSGAMGGTPLPRGFERGRVAIMVEAVERAHPGPAAGAARVSVLRVQVELFRRSGDDEPFVMSATSLQRP
jgi:hypothetical protein